MDTHSNWNLKGKTAVITGASKGIGLATAREFIALGADVIAVARGKETLEKEFSHADLAAKVETVAADVATKEGRAKLLEVVKKRGQLDILVNNVGTNIRKKAVDFSSEDLNLVLQTNLISAIEISRELYPWLTRGTDASVINVSSIASLGSVGSGLIYGATKAALNQVTRALAQEWAPDGIRVNAVLPGYIETELAGQVLNKGSVRDNVINQTMLKRTGRPQEIASAIAFLAMPAASYVTAATMVIDGGMTAFYLDVLSDLARAGVGS